MATYSPTFKYAQRRIRFDDESYPIIVVEINAGTALVDNDVIANIDAILTGYPSSFVGIGDLVITSDLMDAFPGFPDNNQTFNSREITVDNRKYKIASVGGAYWGGTRSCRISFYENSVSIKLFHMIASDAIAATKMQVFSPGLVFYDIVGQKYFYFDAATPGVHEARTGQNMNVLGVIRYNSIPTGAINKNYQWVPPTTTIKLLSTTVNSVLADIIDAPAAAYDDIPESSGAGGGGTYDFSSSDPVDFPSVPELSAVSTGMVSIWSPTEQQMLDLTAFLWNAEPTTVSFWKKLIANPLDLIYGLSIIPVDLRATGMDIIDGTGTVVVGLINTYIEMDKVSRQWLEVDCGSITIDETWGGYLDYDPFTKLEIYLPFCGTHPLRIDDFMPGTISLKYVIDLLTGTCVAMLKSSKTLMHDDNLNSVIYSFQGNCATQIPVTAQQFADSVRSSISLAASIGTMVATGGAAVPGMLASTVDNVMGIKPGVERSGAIGSSGSLLGVRTPYLILTRPRQAQPARQNSYTGYPSFITEKLDDLTGYTELQEIHLENMTATDAEIAEITSLLKGGVIF